MLFFFKKKKKRVQCVIFQKTPKHDNRSLNSVLNKCIQEVVDSDMSLYLCTLYTVLIDQG